jgi:hypothetical protein
MASSRNMPRLRRRPRQGLWQAAWRHRACRIGFIAGFVAGIAFVAGFSRSDGRGIAHAVAATSSANPPAPAMPRAR